MSDQPSYRIKQENDRILVTREDSSFVDDEGDTDFFCMDDLFANGHMNLQSSTFAVDANQSVNYATPMGSGKSNANEGSSEADTNEFLVHGKHENANISSWDACNINGYYMFHRT